MAIDYPDNSVYWRLFINRDDEPVVVEMQWFDEYDYDQSRFANHVHYETEEQANIALSKLKQKLGIPLTNLERIKSVTFENE